MKKTGRTSSALHHAMIGRLVVCGARPAGIREARTLLRQGLAEFKAISTSVKFMITPGGFLDITMEDDWDGSAGWRSGADDIKPFIGMAQQHVRKVMDSRIVTAARACTDFLTLGIDVCYRKRYKAELIGIVDLRPGKQLVIKWTGKSYPTSRQQRRLVQVTDLSSHCVCLARERILVLGCHDLSMWSPRGAANRRKGTHRFKRCKEMDRLVRGFQPTVILHHPHATDHPRVWSDSWQGLLSSPQCRIKAWASAICYYNDGYSCRKPLAKVLTATKSDEVGCIDIIVQS